MQIGDWLLSATNKLKNAGIGSPRLDSLILLEDTTGRDRSYLLAHPEYSLSSEQIHSLADKIEQRCRHRPLAYIRGKTEFYGRTFVVSDYVLEPRSESEVMIEQLLAIRKSFDHPPKVIDIGTGSGCLAITARLELPDSTVEAVDISEEALYVAKQNDELHQTELRFFMSDLLSEVHERYDIILANLPYVPDRFKINKAAEKEPRIAIFGGADGLDLYRKLFDQLQDAAFDVPYVITESLPFQHDDLLDIAAKHQYAEVQRDDLIQVFVLESGAA